MGHYAKQPSVRMNLRRTVVGLTAAGITVMIVLSVSHSFQKRQEVAVSNQLLAGFERRVVNVDPRIYASFVGLYQLEPDFNIAITSDGERLFAQGSNQIRVEIFPASESTYFNEYTEALITFDKPERGESARFTLRQKNQIRYGNRI